MRGRNAWSCGSRHRPGRSIDLARQVGLGQANCRGRCWRAAASWPTSTTCPTLVFDEVDAGIGGEAGLAVGRRLARLAEGRQVLVVTHLPQIACFADRHILVEKGSGTATVRALSDDQRVHELSRMLAGLTGSEGAVTHAEELLATASASRATGAATRSRWVARPPHTWATLLSGPPARRERSASPVDPLRGLTRTGTNGDHVRKERTRPRPRPEAHAAGPAGAGVTRASLASTGGPRTWCPGPSRETSP